MQKKMKVMIISILFMGLLTLNSIAIGFSDVSDNQWFYNSVIKMTEKGIFKGYPDGTFKPDNTVTYGEFIKMFVVAVTGEDVGNNTTGQGHWAKNYYDKGIELGLYTEYDIPEYRLEDGIARKYMALLISNNFKDIEIENYNLVKDRINDLDLGRPYQHQIIKAYGLGIITGYPGGEFKPNGTLTRAESATVISRLLNENERQVPKFEIPIEIVQDSYWKDDPNYEEMVKWLEYGRTNQRYISGTEFRIEEGKFIAISTVNGYREWQIDTTGYPHLNRDMYIVLKKYYEVAKERDYGMSIGIDEYQNSIMIGLHEKAGSTYPLFSFKFSADPYTDANEPNFVKPYIYYNQMRYFTSADFNKYGQDYVIENDRITDQELVDINREIFQELYGTETGNKIMDHALSKYKARLNKDTREQVDLPNDKVNIDGINIFFTKKITNLFVLYMDKPE